MLKIRVYATIFFVSFVWLSSCGSNKEKVPTKTELELSAQLGGIIYLDTTPTIHVATTLFNPTNDTLSFVTMTCSYEDMFLTDTTAFKIQSRYDCYSNYPTVTSLPPHSKVDQYIMVRPINKNIKAIDSKIRVGMYYLIPKKENGADGIIKQYDNRQNGKILWSGELDLKRLYRRIYQ